MSESLTVWLLNPYHTGSHRAWAEGYSEHSRHRVRVLAMEGYFWKWRMQGGALDLAEQARALAAAGERPDILLASSMVNLPAFLALVRRELASIPVVLYMHENQLTYPPPPGSKRDLTYGMIQHLSMLAADRVCFNSGYHMRSWFDELPRLLRHFPDYSHLETIDETCARSVVLPVGCDLCRFDKYHPDERAPTGGRSTAPPLILWNQRWEYDKDPETMLQALYALAEQGVPFRAALAGENFRVQPAEFAGARDRLGERLVHYGFAETEEAYARLLWGADIVLSTAVHEFFGVGLIEALYCGARPVLPRRLSYPDLIPAERHDQVFYDDFEGLLARLRWALAQNRPDPWYRAAATRFDWAVQGPIYDALLSEVVASVSASNGCSRTTTSSA